LARILHRVSLVWALVTVVGLELARRELWLHHRPGAETFEIGSRPVFLALFAVGALLAWRWEIAGGTLAAFTASGVVVWQGRLLAPLDAAIVMFAFGLAGATWVVLDLHDRRPRTAIAGLALVTVAALAGRVVATDLYDDLFGPSHPDSTASLPAGTQVEWIWTGAVTASGFTVTARLDHAVAEPQLLVGERADFSDAVTVRAGAGADAHGVVRFEVTGARPDTDYVMTIRDAAATEPEGDAEVVEARVRTFPAGAASFTLAVGSCIRVGSNGSVFDTIRALDPDLFVLDGDMHYANIGRADPALFRSVIDLQLSRPGPSTLLRSTPVAYVWDDHDFGGNNADGTSPTRDTAQEVYREVVPHYPLASAGGSIEQAFDLGRARVIVTDGRSHRSPATAPDDVDKTMLGDAQQAWLEQELLAARDTYALIIWVNASPWVGEATAGADGWAGYSTERAEIANHMAANRIDNLLMLSGDAHMIAIDDGTNTSYATGEFAGSAGFPLLHAGAIDRPGHTKGGPYSEGMFPGGGQFGLVAVDDRGDHLDVTLTGLDWTGTELVSYSYEVAS
jgi:hypothetical protein